MSRTLHRIVLATLVLAGCGRETTTPTPPASNAGPHLVIEPTVIDAGAVDFGRPSGHAFLVTNAGGQPLTLAVVRKSCSCGEVETPAAIQPGDTGRVVVRWTPIPGKVGPYALTVDLESNDPRHPVQRLEVRGQVNPRVRVAPEDLAYIDFGRLRPGRQAQRELKLYSPRGDDFALEAAIDEGSGLLVNRKRLEKGASIGDHPAVSGWTVAVKTAGSLPAGYLRATLSLVIQVPGEPSRTLTLPVYGEVDSGVVQITPAEFVFQRPRVTEADSRSVLVQFLVPADGQKVEVLRVEPPFVQVDPPRSLGRAGAWQLTARLPANHPEAARYQADGFFEGKVVLRLTGETGERAIRVKWVRPER